MDHPAAEHLWNTITSPKGFDPQRAAQGFDHLVEIIKTQHPNMNDQGCKVKALELFIPLVKAIPSPIKPPQIDGVCWLISHQNKMLNIDPENDEIEYNRFINALPSLKDVSAVHKKLTKLLKISSKFNVEKFLVQCIDERNIGLITDVIYSHPSAIRANVLACLSDQKDFNQKDKENIMQAIVGVALNLLVQSLSSKNDHKIFEALNVCAHAAFYFNNQSFVPDFLSRIAKKFSAQNFQDFLSRYIEEDRTSSTPWRKVSSEIMMSSDTNLTCLLSEE